MEIINRTVEEMLRVSNYKYSEMTAMVVDEKKITYRELYEMVCGLAAAFQKKGLCGKKIEIEAELSAEWIIVFLALTTAGAIVVIHEPYLDTAEYLDDIHMKTTASELFHYEHSKEPLELVGEDAAAVIIFTSGTSGRHKGVVLSHRNVISDAFLGGEMIGDGALKAGDRTIPILPVFHMFGITASFIAPLYYGMTVYVIPEMKYVIRSLPEIRPRILFLVPMIAVTLLNRARLLLKNGMTYEMIRENFLGGLSIVVSGGAVLQPELIDEYKKFGIELLNGYGITECAPIVTTSSYMDFVPGAVGRVNQTSYADVRIIDGTVHVSGDIVMSGYCGDEPDPFKMIEGKRWFDTQDNGYITEDGSLFITGRSSNLIVLSDGNNIAPEEIELRFDKYGIVNSVLVYEKNSAIFASIYPDPEAASEYSEEDLHQIVSETVDTVNQSLPAYKRIRAWSIRTQDFKRTSLKKIIRTEVNYDE